MTPFLIGNIQFTSSLIIYILIAVWYVYPSIILKEWSEAIMPLLLVHCFRYVPLTLLMPGQISENVPTDVAQTIAYGDLISALMALIAVIMVRYKISGAKTAVWIFTLIGFADIAITSVKGIRAGILNMPIGFNLYILNFYVPMLMVSHILIVIALLLKK